MAINWRCPFCDYNAVIQRNDHHGSDTWLTVKNAAGPRFVRLSFIVCPNRDCQKFTMSLTLSEAVSTSGGGHMIGQVLKYWQLIPPSRAKPFPDYIPKPIRHDYEEACLIQGQSPKASATLARRCLQGMIRDFWGVRKSRLIDEIEAIKDRVDPLTWKAIDALRSVGNIGAHMEKDVNVIIDVEPEEAGQLIGLIELLMRDWYITRHEREERLKNIVALAERKDQTKTPTVQEPEPAESEEVS